MEPSRCYLNIRRVSNQVSPGIPPPGRCYSDIRPVDAIQIFIRYGHLLTQRSKRIYHTVKDVITTMTISQQLYYLHLYILYGLQSLMYTTILSLQFMLPLSLLSIILGRLDSQS